MLGHFAVMQGLQAEFKRCPTDLNSCRIQDKLQVKQRLITQLNSVKIPNVGDQHDVSIHLLQTLFPDW